MKRFFAAIVGTLMLTLPGCSGDGAGTPAGPEQADVTGRWDYEATRMLGDIDGRPLSCEVTGAVLILEQQGSSFSGTREGGRLRCFVDGSADDDLLLDTASPVTGISTGTSNVRFGYEIPFSLDRLAEVLEELGFPDAAPATVLVEHQGMMSGSSLSGSAMLMADFGPDLGVLTFTGSWSASGP
ncbi:MAG: hypothetical protein P8Y10_16335 [Gemmatimonadales bacterium]|jgi:hypothetical protein